MQLKIDLHVHTCYSTDSLITPKELAVYAKKRGLHGVAVTDHDTLEGALKTRRETDMLIIPGIEVNSSEGHIVGLNVRETIPSQRGVDETVDLIHDAGGLAVACHPVTLFRGSLGNHVTRKFDAVEVINAAAFPFRYSVRRSKQIASRLSIAQIGGSDAHYAPEIGCAYTVIDAEAQVDDIIRAVGKEQCQPVGSAIPISTRLRKMLLATRRRL